MASQASTVHFVSTADLAVALKAEAVAAREERLFLLPFNRYAARNTYWWLSPKSENPAFKYGKLIIAPWTRAEPEGDFFVGLAVEKGLGDVAEGVYGGRAKTRRWLMDSTWHWRAVLMRAMRSGELDAIARSAEAKASQPLTLWLDAAYASDADQRGDLDLQSIGLRRDVVCFEFSNAKLALLASDLPARILASVASSRDIPTLAAALTALPASDWIWIDFHIGVRLGRSGGSPDWSAAETWAKACRPWLSLVR